MTTVEKIQTLKECLHYISKMNSKLSGNHWSGFFSSHLLPVRFEIERQLSCIDNSSQRTYNDCNDSQNSQ